MHETAIVSGLMRILDTQARAHDVKRIARVTLKVGRLRAVEPAQLRLCFELFAEDTVAAGAQLVIDPVPVRARCTHCQAEFEVPRYRFDCPRCGAGEVTVISGQELYIESFEPAEESRDDER
ncbi:MAG: hydrogenase maturation nickel metallochaperone HypA [Paludibacterium sp.]|uniref:hydrogenase maturation nickel metallochaperone HypA n=1 Tax=Paludibacterium sp. TaxID=1917523 RepID=UPI0025E2ED59|nr:hydrogenase maturation nickel metallochaperone HypA [Paludibacterium sp.]MBV8049445.1 hydrogenase maturation nickel metallochaperone HypA [Paludibacterium sp.]MBV8646109.1 hydrogenase maturation nickel metallochaperone HypA [Paludibacterium sp.]